MSSAVELIDGWGRLHWMALGGRTEKVKDAREFALRIKRPKAVQEAIAKQSREDVPLTTDRRSTKRWFAAHS